MAIPEESNSKEPTTETPATETPAVKALPHDLFHRPRWMVLANLAGAIFFGIAGCATFLAGRLWFPVIWWVLGMFWFRRYLWARDSPFLELTANALLLYLGPGREEALPWNRVKAVTALDRRLDLELVDGTKVGFVDSDLAVGEFPRFKKRVGELATLEVDPEPPSL
jgi:hypothetical protein